MKEFIEMSCLGKYGWFGNQLFQYAALKMYARKHNIEARIPEDWVGRNLFIGCDDPVILNKARELKMIKGETPIWLDGDELKNWDIKGYFQYHTSLYDKEYFQSLFRFVPDLEKMLDEPIKQVRGRADTDSIMGGNTLIGIHIRRGDYQIGSRSANIAPTKWYLKWLKENWGKIDKPVLFIASDDIDNVILDFEAYAPRAFNGGNFLCDHYALQQCHYLLISNSTFSFTAAMLNKQHPHCYRPDFGQKGLIRFDPWDSQVSLSVCQATDGIKLHLGCGNQHIDGYINMDYIETPAVDLIGDVRQLPYADESVEIIESYHVLEHFPVCLHANVSKDYGEKYEALVDVLKEWRRVLRKNGQLIIEVPDIDKVFEEYQLADESKKEELLLSIYGSYRDGFDPDYHRWGANEYRLRYILEKAGFRFIRFEKPQDYHAKTSPCLRVEAIK